MQNGCYASDKEFNNSYEVEENLSFVAANDSFFSQTFVEFLLNTILTNDVTAVSSKKKSIKSNPCQGHRLDTCETNTSDNNSETCSFYNSEDRVNKINDNQLNLLENRLNGNELDKDSEKTLVEKELPDFVSLCENILEQANDLTEYSSSLSSRIQTSTSFDMSKGNSFLELYQHLLLCYLENITFFILLKTHGLPVNNHPVMRRLVEQVLMLEKVLVLYNKLKPKISKLAVLQKDDNELKPQLHLMIEQNDSDNFIVTPEKADNSDVYKPPKLKPVSYNQETHHKDVFQKEKHNRQATAIIHEFLQDFQQTPVEINDEKHTNNQTTIKPTATTNKLKNAMHLLQLQRDFEEENMKRVRSKLEKKVHRGLKSQQHLFSYGSNLNELTSLANSIRSKSGFKSSKKRRPVLPSLSKNKKKAKQK